MTDSVGAELRAAREALGQDIDEVSAALKIRVGHLRAIETGRFGDLPGQTYAIGFVRTYADFLGLDADDIVRRFKDEVVGLEDQTELVFRAPERDTRLPLALVVIGSLLLAGAIYAAWYYLMREPVPEPSAGRDAPQSAMVAETEPPDEAAAAPEDRSVSTESPNAPVERVEPPDDEASDAEGEYAGAAHVETMGTAAREEPAIPEAAGEPEEEVAARAEGIVLRAVADSWVEIRTAGGEILLSRVMSPGETYAVPERPDLTMIAGNAGAIRVTVNGTEAPPLGEDGAVRRGIELSAPALLAGPSQ